MRRKYAQIISWNVNGIRAIIKKGFADFLATHNPDILCLQEIKAHPEQVELPFTDYHCFWNPAERRGYSGTAIFSRLPPLAAHNGIGISKHDTEGRVLTLEYPGCFLVTVYTPNSQRELTRLAYRTEEWERDFLGYLKELEQQKPVVFCGDLNVAHEDIDLANPKTNRRNAGFTDEERERFRDYLRHGFVDTFRQFEKGPGHYTWWSYRPGIRERNIGWRIDYFCVSQALKDQVKQSEILANVMGSDHCPIRLRLASDLFLPRP